MSPEARGVLKLRERSARQLDLYLRLHDVEKASQLFEEERGELESRTNAGSTGARDVEHESTLFNLGRPSVAIEIRNRELSRDEELWVSEVIRTSNSFHGHR